LRKELLIEFENMIKDPINDIKESRTLANRDVQRRKEMMKKYEQARAEYHKGMTRRKLNSSNYFYNEKNR
jgi:hypothetical protein